MPVIRDRLNLQNRNGIRADQRIEALAQPVRSQLALDIDMSTDRQRMDPGIGAAGGDELRLLAGHALHRLLEALLDRRPVLLPLPAHEWATVIFDRELPARHGKMVPMGSGKPRKKAVACIADLPARCSSRGTIASSPQAILSSPSIH